MLFVNAQENDYLTRSRRVFKGVACGAGHVRMIHRSIFPKLSHSDAEVPGDGHNSEERLPHKRKLDLFGSSKLRRVGAAQYFAYVQQVARERIR